MTTIFLGKGDRLICRFGLARWEKRKNTLKKNAIFCSNTRNLNNLFSGGGGGEFFV